VRTRSAKRGPLVASAAIAMALLLGGCGSAPPPGTASVISGTKISRSDVDELAEAQCAGIVQAAKSGQSQSQEAPRKQLVQQALSLLMDIEFSLQFGKSEHVTPRPEESAATYSQIDPLIKTLPKKYQPFMESVFHRWAEARDILTQVGEQVSGQTPTASNAEQLINAGYQKREPWLKTRDVKTDPRYGPAGIGWPGGADPSVSKPVSSFAKSGGKTTPDAAWVSALPSSQKCG
jgi:hypothetical protein